MLLHVIVKFGGGSAVRGFHAVPCCPLQYRDGPGHALSQVFAPPYQTGRICDTGIPSARHGIPLICRVGRSSLTRLWGKHSEIGIQTTIQRVRLTLTRTPWCRMENL